MEFTTQTVIDLYTKKIRITQEIEYYADELKDILDFMVEEGVDLPVNLKRRMTNDYNKTPKKWIEDLKN